MIQLKYSYYLITILTKLYPHPFHSSHFIYTCIYNVKKQYLSIKDTQFLVCILNLRWISEKEEVKEWNNKMEKEELLQDG